MKRALWEKICTTSQKSYGKTSEKMFISTPCGPTFWWRTVLQRSTAWLSATQDMSWSPVLPRLPGVTAGVTASTLGSVTSGLRTAAPRPGPTWWGQKEPCLPSLRWWPKCSGFYSLYFSLGIVKAKAFSKKTHQSKKLE